MIPALCGDLSGAIAERVKSRLASQWCFPKKMSIPIYEVPAGSIVPPEDADERQRRRTSRFISALRFAAWLLALVVVVMLVIVLALSLHFPSERKLIPATLLGVFVAVLAGVLFVVRRDPDLCIVFAGTLLFLDGVTFAFAVQYI